MLSSLSQIDLSKSRKLYSSHPNAQSNKRLNTFLTLTDQVKKSLLKAIKKDFRCLNQEATIGLLDYIADEEEGDFPEESTPVNTLKGIIARTEPGEGITRALSCTDDNNNFSRSHPKLFRRIVQETFLKEAQELIGETSKTDIEDIINSNEWGIMRNLHQWSSDATRYWEIQFQHTQENPVTKQISESESGSFTVSNLERDIANKIAKEADKNDPILAIIDKMHTGTPPREGDPNKAMSIDQEIKKGTSSHKRLCMNYDTGKKELHCFDSDTNNTHKKILLTAVYKNMAPDNFITSKYQQTNN